MRGETFSQGSGELNGASCWSHRSVDTRTFLSTQQSVVCVVVSLMNIVILHCPYIDIGGCAALTTTSESASQASQFNRGLYKVVANR